MKNVQLKELIRILKKTAIEQKVSLWKRIASDLEKPTRRRRTVNLSKIDQYAKENETVIVPGKVLSMGDVSRKVNVVAYSFSNNAAKKLLDAKCGAMYIADFVIKCPNPKGKRVRILG